MHIVVEEDLSLVPVTGYLSNPIVSQEIVSCKILFVIMIWLNIILAVSVYCKQVFVLWLYPSMYL